MMMNESNKLIAEFMGYKFYNNLPEQSNGYQLPKDKGTAIYLANSTSELQYHEDWNWLMPVVHKCFEVSSFKIEGDMKGLVLWLQIADIKGAYRTIVEFITVYNRENGNNND